MNEYTIWGLLNSPNRNATIGLLSKFKISPKYLQQKLTDQSFIEIFKDIPRPIESKGDKNIQNYRAKIRLAEIKKVLGPLEIIQCDDNIKKYLDIGANDCTITQFVGRGLGFAPEQIYAVDVEDFSEAAATYGIHFALLTDLPEELKLPFADNSFSLVNFFTSFTSHSSTD